jgi:hypothetical protein
MVVLPQAGYQSAGAEPASHQRCMEHLGLVVQCAGLRAAVVSVSAQGSQSDSTSTVVVLSAGVWAAV